MAGPTKQSIPPLNPCSEGPCVHVARGVARGCVSMWRGVVCPCGKKLCVHVARGCVSMWWEVVCPCVEGLCIHMARGFVSMWLGVVCLCCMGPCVHVARSCVFMWQGVVCPCGKGLCALILSVGNSVGGGGKLHPCTCGSALPLSYRSAFPATGYIATK